MLVCLVVQLSVTMDFLLFCHGHCEPVQSGPRSRCPEATARSARNSRNPTDWRCSTRIRKPTICTITARSFECTRTILSLCEHNRSDN
ncbi:hypothetical protein EDD18DRAFT_201506 [Armillaria luteobubalina]|uniref:Secreted protein n=1 Tax=Armillaria luteobubalina TaxID=153913 RepID=A0AA39Q628_9AGAR|nr:hypothetical protein EDD18DRAFT_201506 [Armillaria luteobubalina]